MATKKAASKKKVTKVDFDNEESVLRAMAKELDIEKGDLTISTDESAESFRTGGAFYQIELVGPGESRPSKSWTVARNEDEAHDLAVAVVKQDLEDEPGNFEENFIQSHINMDRVRRDLISDVQNMRHEDLQEEAERRPLEFMKANDIDIPEPSDRQLREYAEAMSDEDKSAADILKELAEMSDAEDRWITIGEEPEVKDSDIEEIAEKEAEAQLKNPLEYLEEIFGREDAVKKAIEIGGIDIDAAAEEAVSTDGEGHFLSHYDGHMQNGPDGIVYWRTN